VNNQQGQSNFIAMVNPRMILLIIVVLGLAQERSKRREMESLNLSRLRAKQLDALLNATTEAACMIDKSGYVLLCNQAMADLLEKPLQDISGTSFYDLVAQDIAARDRELVASVLATERANRSEGLRNGSWFDQVIYPVREDNGPIRFLAIYIKDISALKQREEKLVFEALHDPLTGLANRRFMQSRLKQAINRARRSYPSSLLLIDLDHFKEINDRYGHDAGDRVLVTVAKILQEGRRDYDSVFRTGGDEFAILVDGATIGEAQVVAERIRAAVASREFEAMGSNDGKLSLSIGGVMVDAALSGDEIIKLADEAMYRAKQAGRNRVVMAENRTE
jgi:diguanylate cyclase (GGDEF)-like protein/PAS domain S-box-containing protein